MRKKIVAGNWKMNKQLADVENFATEFLSANIEQYSNQVDIMLFPPSIYAHFLQNKLAKAGIIIGTQNVSEYNNGAYTGEISAQMLNGLGLKHCIIGHSERRKYFHEDHEILKNKLLRLSENDITPIFCCGEVLDDRNNNNHFNVVESQLNDSIFQLPTDIYKNIIIAYEPVWAIGTGVTASAEQAQEMHAFIRNLFAKKSGEEFAKNARILYGGSVSEKNCAELFACPDIDGGLIGGASLKTDSLLKIIENTINL